MSDVVSDEGLNTLAAEYVLGTLDYEERQGAKALLEVDPTFRGIVKIWERRFGELHLMVEAVEPDPRVWERIRPKIADVEQIMLAIPSVPIPPISAEPAPPPQAVEWPEESPAAVADGAPVESHDATSEAEGQLKELAALLPVVEGGAPRFQESPPPPPPPPARPEVSPERKADEIPRGFVPPAPMIRRPVKSPPQVPPPVRRPPHGWIAATAVAALVAIILAGLISAWRFFPDRLPPRLRADTVFNLQPPAPPPQPPPRPKPPSFDE